MAIRSTPTLTPLCRSLAIALATLWLAAPAHGDIYKCLGDNSKPVYQDSPCPPGREMRNFQTDPATVSVVPFDFPSSPPAPASAGSTEKHERAPSHKPRATTSARRAHKSKIPEGNAAERKFLHLGMSQAEVLARVGAPDMKSGGGRGGGARWSYLPDDADPEMITTLHFRAGQLAQIDRKVVR